MKVKELINVLDLITGGRVVTSTDDLFTGRNPFVVVKSSNIPGKAIVETPGLVYGDPEAEIKRIAVAMTLTESCIELAGATGVNVIITHHPIADAANSGGVTLENYLGLYNISAVELHEAFHGLHPGLSFLHGHKVFRVDIKYSGIPGNIVYVGRALDDVNTLGDILHRLNKMMNLDKEHELANAEKSILNYREMYDSATALSGQIIIGSPDTPVNTILHIFPHTGFTSSHLVQVKNEHPEIDTVLATISRVNKESEIVKKAEELNLNFVCGNSHSMEIYENGLPLAYAIRNYIPKEVDIVMFRERISSVKLDDFGSAGIQNYAKYITETYLINK